MLGDNDAIATIAVVNIDRAKAFYGEKLGFKQKLPAYNPSVVTYESGRSAVLVYESQYAGTNQATVATWSVGDLEPIVEALRTRGVTFEHYDFHGLIRQGDIHVFDRLKTVWLKDPDGNILSIVSTGA